MSCALEIVTSSGDAPAWKSLRSGYHEWDYGIVTMLADAWQSELPASSYERLSKATKPFSVVKKGQIITHKTCRANVSRPQPFTGFDVEAAIRAARRSDANTGRLSGVRVGVAMEGLSRHRRGRQPLGRIVTPVCRVTLTSGMCFRFAGLSCVMVFNVRPVP